MKAWRAANAERNRETERRYLRNNPESATAASRAATARYAKANPHKGSERKARRRALLADAPRVEKIDREYIIARDNSSCHICGKRVARKDLHLDHLIALSKGGSHTADNLRVAHKWCNGSMGVHRKPAQLLLIG
jgi:5-methylcytosine-specific restriction endonuclease McrA